MLIGKATVPLDFLSVRVIKTADRVLIVVRK